MAAVGGGREVIEIVITGSSAEGVAATERQTAALKGLSAEAKAAGASAMAMGTRMQSQGRALSTFGASWTRNVTTPIVAFGAAAGKFAYDFQKSMLLIQTHTDTTRKNLDLYKRSILEMASSGKYTQGPKELADAMYHVASDGFRGQKALKALKASADLAMVGQADLATTTYALVSVLKTHIRGINSATDATKQMNAVVGAGDMKMQDLVSAMSTGIMPAAKSMGLSFKDVGAALDVMTSRGVPAQQASYRLSMNFQQLVPYTNKAKDAFTALGLGQDALAKQIHGPHGFLDALILLQSHLSKFDKYQQGTLIRDIFGGGRTSRGMLMLLQNLGDMRHNYERINTLQNETQKNLRDFRATPVFKLHAAWAQIQADLVKIGGELLPAAVPAFDKLASVLKDVSNWFTHLSPGARSTALEILAITAAVGPLLKLFGGLLRVGGTFLKFGGSLVAYFARLGGAQTEEAAAAERGAAAQQAQLVATERLAAALEALVASYGAATVAGERFAATQSGLIVPAEMAATRGAVAEETAMATTGAAGGRFGKWGAVGKGAGMFGLAAAATIGGPMLGQAIGGRTGGAISGLGMGAGMGFMFGGPVGAAIGGVGGLIATQLMSKGPDIGASIGDHFVKTATKRAPEIQKALTARNLGGLQDQRNLLRWQTNVLEHFGGRNDQWHQLHGQLAAVNKDIGQIGSNRQTALNNMADLRSGLIQRMADINKTFKTDLTAIDAGWKHGSNQWHIEVGHNMEATARAIENGMRSGVIPRTQANLDKVRQLIRNAHLFEGRDPLGIVAAFGQSWIRAGGVNDRGVRQMISTLNKLPPSARQTAGDTMVTMAEQLRNKGEITKASFARIISALATEGHVGGLKASMAFARGIAPMTDTINALGRAITHGMGGIIDQVNKQLAAFKAKPLKFQVQTGVNVIAGGLGLLNQLTGGGKAKGGIVKERQLYEVGEEAPAHHEWVIATNPAYQRDNLRYWAQAGHDLGVPGFAKGGAVGGGSPELNSFGSNAVELVREAGSELVRRSRPRGGGPGPPGGPKGVGSWHGLPMANWVIAALDYAVGRGVRVVPTSGYRPGFDPHTSSGHSEHSGTQYPHGAVDFGGPVDPAALAMKLAVVHATSSFKWPLLAPIGFRDDGHASGTGHRRGGLRRARIIGSFAGGGSPSFVTGPHHHYTVKGSPATRQQMNTAAEIMRVIATVHANKLASEAILMAATQESVMGAAGNTFQLTGPKAGVTPGSSAYAQGLAWMRKGFYIHGSGLHLSHTMHDPGAIAQAVEGSAFPKAYSPWRSEADRWIAGWSGPGGGAAGSTGLTASQKTIQGRNKQLSGLVKALHAAHHTYAFADDMTALTNLDQFWQKFGTFTKPERQRMGQLRRVYQTALGSPDPNDDLRTLRALVKFENAHGKVGAGKAGGTANDTQKAHELALKHLLKVWAKARKTPAITDDISVLMQIDKLYEDFGSFSDSTTPQWDVLKKNLKGAAAGAPQLSALKTLVAFERRWGTLSGKGAASADTTGADTGGTTGPDLQAQIDLLTQQLQVSQQNLGMQTAQFATLGDWLKKYGTPYVGAFGGGGIVPGPEGRPYLATVHGGEAIGPQGAPIHITFVGDIGSVVDAHAPGMVQLANRSIGRTRRTLSFAPGG